MRIKQVHSVDCDVGGPRKVKRKVMVSEQHKIVLFYYDDVYLYCSTIHLHLLAHRMEIQRSMS